MEATTLMIDFPSASVLLMFIEFHARKLEEVRLRLNFKIGSFVLLLAHRRLGLEEEGDK